MSVRRKVLVIIAATCVGLMAVLFGVGRAVILGNARHDEQVFSNRTMYRLQELLNDRLSSLKRLSLDHAMSDGTYQLVQQPDPRFDLLLFGFKKDTNPLARQ